MLYFQLIISKLACLDLISMGIKDILIFLESSLYSYLYLY